jgi:hypothetical protein
MMYVIEALRLAKQRGTALEVRGVSTLHVCSSRLSAISHVASSPLHLVTGIMPKKIWLKDRRITISQITDSQT